MGAPVYTWTPDTETGFLNDELEALWAQINTNETDIGALPGNLDDLTDVRIVGVADDEVLAYHNATSQWKNQTAAEAGLAVSGHDHDADYAALVHTHTLLSDRTIVSLTAGSAIHDAGITHYIAGANTDVGSLQFPDSTTNNAIWTFRRPSDWDSGQIRITWYWANMTASVAGNHYFAQRLTGWADGEDYSTPNGNTMIAGATTVTGLSNQGKIGTHELDDSGVVTLSNEDFFIYRMQRQGGHGSDTSGQPWHIQLITFELIAI